MKWLKRFFYKLGWLIYFILYIIWEVLASSIRVSQDVLSPRLKIAPGVLAIPLGGDSDIEITLIGNLVSYTPGTLTLDVSTDHRTLFVHTMFADEADMVRHEIQYRLERVILRILR